MASVRLCEPCGLIQSVRCDPITGFDVDVDGADPPEPVESLDHECQGETTTPMVGVRAHWFENAALVQSVKRAANVGCERSVRSHGDQIEFGFERGTLSGKGLVLDRGVNRPTESGIQHRCHPSVVRLISRASRSNGVAVCYLRPGHPPITETEPTVHPASGEPLVATSLQQSPPGGVVVEYMEADGRRSISRRRRRQMGLCPMHHFVFDMAGIGVELELTVTLTLGVSNSH